DVRGGRPFQKGQQIDFSLLARVLLSLFRGAREQNSLPPQQGSQSFLAIGVAVTFDSLAARRLDAAECIDAHAYASATVSSCVAATTSSTVVTPSKALRAPSSRNVFIPR